MAKEKFTLLKMVQAIAKQQTVMKQVSEAIKNERKQAKADNR